MTSLGFNDCSLVPHILFDLVPFMVFSADHTPHCDDEIMHLNGSLLVNLVVLIQVACVGAFRQILELEGIESPQSRHSCQIHLERTSMEEFNPSMIERRVVVLHAPRIAIISPDGSD